jgi:glycosyltransferase involved in cell wall biosynthesis
MNHVCVDARLYSATGIGTLLQGLLAYLARRDCYKLSLLCHERQKEMLHPLSSHLIPMQSAIYTVQEQLEYVSKIPRCDLFWAPHFNVPLLPIRAKKRLTTINDVSHLAHFSTLSFSQKVYAKCLYNAAFSLSDQLMTISEFSKKEILKYASLKPKKLAVITPCFDFSPPPYPVEKKGFLLSVGNLKPQKNLVRLVKAYAKLAPKEPLYIVGKREGLITYDTQLFEEVEKTPFLKRNVHFTGYVTQNTLKELYAQATLFLFPSTYEGYGYPPLEAMACGCPVIASQTASIPEVCEEAVEYVDPFSIDSIKQAMARLLNVKERREELIQKGKELIAKRGQQKERNLEVIGKIIDACCNRT